MAKSQTERISSFPMAIVVFALVAAAMAGCGSDETALTEVPSAEAAAVETAAAVAPKQTKVPEAQTTIGANDTYPRDTPGFIDTSSLTAPVEVLPATSETCVTLARLKVLNNRSTFLTDAFSERVFSAAYQEATTDVEKRWEEDRMRFAADTESLLAELGAVYATLASEQPQFETYAVKVNDWIGRRLKAGARVRYRDLDNIESILATAVSPEVALDAGRSTLRIAAFARSACGVVLANP